MNDSEARAHECLHVLVSGLVQGVGFRHSLYRQALQLGVTGWVRNLSDGRVEARCEGSREILESMLDWCHRGPGLSRVDDVSATWDAAVGDFDGFEIRF